MSTRPVAGWNFKAQPAGVEYSAFLFAGPALGLAGTLAWSRLEPVLRRILAHGEWRRGQVDQFAELQPEPFGHLDQRGEADVELPAGFDLLVVLVGQSGALGERFLGQAADDYRREHPKLEEDLEWLIGRLALASFKTRCKDSCHRIGSSSA